MGQDAREPGATVGAHRTGSLGCGFFEKIASLASLQPILEDMKTASERPDLLGERASEVCESL